MKVLVVVAHPDDEVLGCGATIAKHCEDGDDVFVLFLADGVTSRIYEPQSMVSRDDELKQSEGELTQRKNELKEALNILGVRDLNMKTIDFPDQRMDSLSMLDIVKEIEKVKEEVKPDIVYTHFWGDLNRDHRITFEAVITAFRPVNGARNEEIYCFEIPETTDWGIPTQENKFVPNHFVDTAHTIDKKLEAMQAYDSEKREYPHPRSIEAIRTIAQERGKVKELDSAEAFVKI